MDDHQRKVIDDCAPKLGEAFESALILVSGKEGISGGTSMSSYVRGNFYAARGMAQDFLDRERSIEQANQIKSALGDGYS